MFDSGRTLRLSQMTRLHLVCVEGMTSEGSQCNVKLVEAVPVWQPVFGEKVYGKKVRPVKLVWGRGEDTVNLQ